MKNKKIKFTKMEGLHFIPIGGCSSIGMNMYAYIYNDQWILVDMGMGFDSEFGKELLIPSPDLLIKNKSKIKAIFITHSHEDHIGAIPYLWQMVGFPIYARPFAIEMIRDKLFQFGMENDVPLIKSSSNTVINVGDFSVEFIPVAHSTPESSAIAITTAGGTIIHTGDWRIDNDPVLGDKTDEKRLKEYGEKGVLALICDSTNVFKEHQDESEKEVRKNLIDFAKKSKKNRIIVTCFASNLARLESCYYAAKESGRQLIIAGRSLKKIERIAKISGYFSDIPAFLDERKINSVDPAKSLIVCTGSQGEQRSALSKIARGTHKFINVQENDVILFSSKVIPGNENSVLDIQNLLISKGVRIVTEIDHDIHASGHPTKEELQLLYSLVTPKILIPVHGETIHLYKHAEIAKNFGIKNILIPEDGCVIKFDDNKASIIDNIPNKTLAVDGNKLIPTDGIVYKQRKILSCSGVVSALVEYRHGVTSLIDMQSSGIFEDSEQVEMTDIRNDIASEIKLSIDNISKGKTNIKDIKISVEKIIRNMFVDVRGKFPVVFVHLIKK